MGARRIDPEAFRPADTALLGGPPGLETAVRPPAGPLRRETAAATVRSPEEAITGETGPAPSLGPTAADTTTAASAAPEVTKATTGPTATAKATLA